MRLSELIGAALSEDIGNGDVTAESTIPLEQNLVAIIRAKQDMVFFGHELGKEVFRQLGVSYAPLVEDGTRVASGTHVAKVSGNARACLSGERVALNLMMRMSGISTHTAKVVEGISGIKVVDTRKTTPLWRKWERAAVKAGGGGNHRFALYDGILIKDNHISAVGSIKAAIAAAKSHAHHLLKIEIEVEDLQQLSEAIEAGADVVMLDNMSDDELKEAIELAAGRVLIEASGNMNAERIKRIQHYGIDVVSMGGLIHQATWADLSMKISSS